MSNSEAFCYIRHQDESGHLHRVGVIILAPIDSCIYISGSLCNPMDKFNPLRAKGIARSRYNKAYANFHLSTNVPGNNVVMCVDSKIFLRKLVDDINITTVLSNLGLLNPIKRYYTVDFEQLDAIFAKELNDNLEALSR